MFKKKYNKMFETLTSINFLISIKLFYIIDLFISTHYSTHPNKQRKKFHFSFFLLIYPLKRDFIYLISLLLLSFRIFYLLSFSFLFPL